MFGQVPHGWLLAQQTQDDAQHRAQAQRQAEGDGSHRQGRAAQYVETSG